MYLCTLIPVCRDGVYYMLTFTITQAVCVCLCPLLSSGEDVAAYWLVNISGEYYYEELLNNVIVFLSMCVGILHSGGEDPGVH